MNFTKVEKYYKYIKDRFPEVSDEDLKTILDFGFKSLYSKIRYNEDVFLSGNGVRIIFGNVFGDQIKRFCYNVRKKQKKNRYKYRCERTEYDGYYYFSLTQNEHDKYISGEGTKNEVARLQKVVFYKILDDCTCEHRKYVYRVIIPEDFGFDFYCKELTTRNHKLLMIYNQKK